MGTHFQIFELETSNMNILVIIISSLYVGYSQADIRTIWIDKHILSFNIANHPCNITYTNCNTNLAQRIHSGFHIVDGSWSGLGFMYNMTSFDQFFKMKEFLRRRCLMISKEGYCPGDSAATTPTPASRVPVQGLKFVSPLHHLSKLHGKLF